MLGAPISDSIFKQPRRFRCKTVIASEAKQSIFPLRGEVDCFASLAMTVDTRSHSRDALRPSCTGIFRPIQSEGAGNAGCALHPRSRVQIVESCAHEHTGPAESIRPSLRNGLTAYGALSPETNSSCLRHRRIDGFANPVGLAKTSADLTPATGARTTRFCRTQ